MFLTRSENEEDVTTLSVNQRVMVLSVGDPAAAAAAFSVEMSDSSDISSRSSFYCFTSIIVTEVSLKVS